jgi:hypothetical protein
MSNIKKNENSESVVEIEKSQYKDLVKNGVLLKRENENLKMENEEIQKIALNELNKMKKSGTHSSISASKKISEKHSDMSHKEEDNEATSAVFKRKTDHESSRHQSTKKQTSFKTVSVKDSSNSSSVDTDTSSSGEFIEDTLGGKSSKSDSSDSTEYTSESDIYRTANTEDGINRTYKKLNDEMERISRTKKYKKMSNKEVANRIDFLLNGLGILDKLKGR